MISTRGGDIKNCDFFDGRRGPLPRRLRLIDLADEMRCRIQADEWRIRFENHGQSEFERCAQKQACGNRRNRESAKASKASKASSKVLDKSQQPRAFQFILHHV